MSECACGQQRTLWKTPVENPKNERDDAMSFVKDKSLTAREDAVDALIHATDVLAARLDAVELIVIELFGILETPLTPQERIDRVREIRGQLR
jgi:hypothetical protein